MINSILNFIKKEKGYALLTLICVGVFTYLAVVPASHSMKDRDDTPEMHKFKAAEQQLQKEVDEKGSLETYLKGNPGLAKQVAALSFFMLIAFSVGLGLNIYWITKPVWRKGLAYAWEPQTTPWSYVMIYKVVVLFIVFSFGIGLILAFLRHLGGDASSNFFILLHTTIMDVMCFFFVKKVVLESGGNLRDLGFRVPERQPLREVFFAWGSYISILPIFGILLMVLLAIANLLHYEPPSHPLVSVFLEEDMRAKPLIIYSIFLAVVAGPIFEEIFFRGFFYSVLRSKLGVRWAMVVTSAFFALIHENTFAFWPIFALGMVLAYIYEKRGSLLTPIVLHITHNAIFIYYFFVAKDIVGLVK